MPTADSISDPLKAARAEATAASARFSLPFSQRRWQGPVGISAGQGSGSSIEFEDHRPYALGDDPRHINWQAWARTGHLTMKLFRREVSPFVDLVLDQSASMRLFPDKASRALALAYFVSAEGRRNGCPVRIHGINGTSIRRLDADRIDLGSDSDSVAETPFATPNLRNVAFRAGGMRIFISDLLYPGSCRDVARPLISGGGRAIIFAPWAESEATPDWRGNIQLVDCEAAVGRDVHASPALIERYHAAYQRHFSGWQTGCRELAITFVPLPAALPLTEGLLRHALPCGAVSPCT